MIEKLSFKTKGKGLYEITKDVAYVVKSADLEEGLCTVFIPHTSASLIIQENADPSARRDLENWINRFVDTFPFPYTHVSEGADDMPAHVKAAFSQTSISIPISEKKLTLGFWQGIFLWEHRATPHTRSVVIQVR